MSTFGCRLRRQCRSLAILVLALTGLLMPATAAMSLAQPNAPAVSAAASAKPIEGLFAPAKAKPNVRGYHQPADGGGSGGASAAFGFWMLAGLSLMLLAGALAPASRTRGRVRGGNAPRSR